MTWPTTLSACALLIGLAACDPVKVAEQAASATRPGEVTIERSADGAVASLIRTCTKPASREVAFTAPDAKDVLAATALGKDCEQAAVVLTLRTADGKLLWSHASLAGDTGAFIPDDETKPVDAAKVLADVMKSMVDNARIAPSTVAPDWPEGAERPQQESGLYVTTTLDRAAYLEQRAKGAATLCISYVMGRTGCAIRDPDSGYVSDFYELSS